ncbi:MAG: InlB B-repeat-containing protein, partial [Clostridia bacterium]|nr:InlB B-repeat-containing protein [Clostridia bacterium]
TFNTSGGSVVDSQIIEYGALVQEPIKPTYEGFKFVGWSNKEDGTVPVDFTSAITGNTTYYAIWNKIVNVKQLLQSLLDGYELNPIEYIPESMYFDYSNNLVEANEIINDYSTFRNISNITYGFGQQWHMVLDNLRESKVFFDVLSVVDAISSASIMTFNNYFDQNPSNTANHSFEIGIYSVIIDFDGETIFYVLDYTATLPVLGLQTIQIALSMNVDSGERMGRIQIGDAHALSYNLNEDGYEFAIKYLGVRRALFTIEKDANDNVVGHIFEYLTVSSVEIASAADFYITDDYVSVVGNKSSGLVGFKGYITELYSASNGELLAYEVKETLLTIEYNTIWFNLDSITGLNSIKYISGSGDVPAKIYVNGNSSVWANKEVGGIVLINPKARSRRFDIEFRTQYVYSYDSTNEKYVEHEIEVPMIFVQEENYNTFISDVKDANNINIATTLSSIDLNKLLSDYDELIPMFVQNKDMITPSIIIEKIGEKVVFN